MSELKQREERLDVLVNNAGASWGATIEEYPEDGWDKVMDLNVKAVFMLTESCCLCSGRRPRRTTRRA